ncbi:MAG: tRNA (adenosine(37)-N6)-threonylcarbamoyltransferase complex transferase subunit TsaD [Gammaproteobacteria bacterium]|nr:MAG: tRNA (adenosine(37)-N6)-threonylcarbamoyltransferase complex transferase subunit TsaD [Gammaproteobacteria bacterium]
MKILGIESSCDDTGIAIYDEQDGIIANCLHSQIELHNEYGGVVPELASRDHIRKLSLLLKEALKIADIDKQQIDAVSYTKGPGLVGALLTGVAFAKSFAFALEKPAIAVNHLEGHIMASMLADKKPKFPALVLLVSGGHTMLLQVKNFGEYKLLGESCDDAAGEAFDKTAKLLGLPYPGGAILSKLSEKGKKLNIKFPRPMIKKDNFDFSFSGLKTAVLLYTQKQKTISEQDKSDIAKEFQNAVVEVLTYKTLKASQKTGIKNIIIAGGVGANKQLRLNMKNTFTKIGGEVFYPPLKYCTDNAAMIAYAGFRHFKNNNIDKDLGIAAQPRWQL